MPKYDPFRRLRIIPLIPEGKNLGNQSVGVELMQNGDVQVTDSRGMVFKSKPNMPVRILATAKNPCEVWPPQYTVTIGKIDLNEPSKLKIVIPQDVELVGDFDYAALFPKKTVVKKPLLKKLLGGKLQK